MGLKCVPDFSQRVMGQVLHELENIEVYLDDISIFGNTLE